MYIYVMYFINNKTADFPHLTMKYL